jgi:hypothetical protein
MRPIEMLATKLSVAPWLPTAAQEKADRRRLYPLPAFRSQPLFSQAGVQNWMSGLERHVDQHRSVLSQSRVPGNWQFKHKISVCFQMPVMPDFNVI